MCYPSMYNTLLSETNDKMLYKLLYISTLAGNNAKIEGECFQKGIYPLLSMPYTSDKWRMIKSNVNRIYI